MTAVLALVPTTLPDPSEVPLGTVPTKVLPQAVALRQAAREAESIPDADRLRRDLMRYEKWVQDKKTHDLVAAESRRTEVVIGQLLGPAEVGTNQHSEALRRRNASEISLYDRHRFRLLAKYEERVERWLAEGVVSREALLGRINRLEERPAASQLAEVDTASWEEWLPQQAECDLLLTDPPYMTDLDEPVERFAARWLPEALDKVKATGRAYVCIGAYPRELAGYLAAPRGHMILGNVLVWHYRNTLGPKPNHDYKQTWQAVLHFRGAEAPPLDCPKMTEQFDVQDINAPDGRRGERDHVWQKPDELGERFVRHATAPGELVLDPFAGTGTFVLAAARLGRFGLGCERDPKMLEIARERGCRVAGA